MWFVNAKIKTVLFFKFVITEENNRSNFNSNYFDKVIKYENEKGTAFKREITWKYIMNYSCQHLLDKFIEN